MMAGTGLKAQEISITLVPGWNWISYTNAVSMEIGEALGDFTPVQGDIIKSKNNGTTTYTGTMWRGSLTHFIPGQGYKYFSARTETTSFVFAQAPSSIVTTSEPTNITTARAVVSITVTLDEGNHLYTRGVCWDTVHMPKMNENHISNGTGTGVITVTLTGLAPSTTYYVRAYVVTDYGLAYGEEKSFTTLDNGNNAEIPEGAINGLFTINANGDQVYFSKGNLQYIGSAITPYWKFADNQWDYLGENEQVGSNQNADRDLFGWGTSGYNHGAIAYQPWSTSQTENNYFAYGNQYYHLFSQTGQADWGYNPIDNGGNIEGIWRTLKRNEWVYVFNSRPGASSKYGHGNVNGCNGIILLPDIWVLPQGLSFTSGNSEWANVYDEEQWAQMESNGAVFLPAAGYRYTATSLLSVGSRGFYWSSSSGGGFGAINMIFNSNSLYLESTSYRATSSSVRLVHDY